MKIDDRKFGRLKIIESEDDFHYLCRCDCGNFTIVYYKDLFQEKITSCGCEKKEREDFEIFKEKVLNRIEERKVQKQLESLFK